MKHAPSIACVQLALLMAPAAALASVDAFVFQNGPAFIVDNGSVVNGHASAELGGGGTEGAGSFFYVGSAYADNRSGALGVAAAATGAGYAASNDRLVVKASASFSELLTFSDTGPVTFRLAVQGTFASVSGGQMTSLGKLSVDASSNLARTSWRGGLTRMDLNTHLHSGATTLVSDLPSNYIVWLEQTVMATAAIPILVAGLLEVTVSPPVTGQASALFDHTAQLSIFMPAGVSFTSQSGDFLAGATTPVPELATAWLYLAGMLLIGALVRRRTAALQPLAA